MVTSQMVKFHMGFLNKFYWPMEHGNMVNMATSNSYKWTIESGRS